MRLPSKPLPILNSTLQFFLQIINLEPQREDEFGDLSKLITNVSILTNDTYVLLLGVFYFKLHNL